MKTVILLATYNGQEYLSQQLDSVFAQSSQDFDLFIHDDGSSDGTMDIIRHYQDSYGDRIKLLPGPIFHSAKLSFMWMLKEVEADYYFFCDQDDVWHKDKVKNSLEILNARDGAKPLAVFCDMEVVDEDLNLIDSSFINYLGRSPENLSYTQIIIDNPASGTSMGFNRALRDIAIGGQDIDFDKVPMHDAWLLEIAAIYGQIAFINSPMVKYRQTGHNLMGASTESDSEKIARNIDIVKSGSFLHKKREFVNESRRFAKELIKLPDMPLGKAAVLREFANIGDRNKFYRLGFYKKYGFNRAKHTLWFYLWV
ncbi:MAG: glycosyltransferase family 2 protein [Pseudobutyrivibrio sp.]|nr:glycosyltransferase family 2 protein [Pseudobutyrivibrio sp.]